MVHHQLKFSSVLALNLCVHTQYTSLSTPLLITCDFNLDIQKDSSNKKVNDLCQQFSLKQLITDPTHYTETSSSTIDLIFTSNTNNIQLSGTGEPFLEQNVRYHSPVYAMLKFHIKPTAV